MLVAAALERQPAVLVAENPTRGLDLRAARDIHGRLRMAAGQGVAVVVHLADLDELLEVATRIVVLSHGVLAEPGLGAGRDEIGRAMLAARPE
jgi:simple sugar transport system ATP-binding protein